MKEEKEEKEEKEVDGAELIINSERRVYPRIALSTHVKYSIVSKKEEITEHKGEYIQEELFKKGMENLKSDKVNETRTINISASGLLMTVDEYIPVGSILHLTMHLPLPGFACKCSILGEVVRCDKKDNSYHLGIKFLKIVHHNLNKYKYATLKELLNIDGPSIKLD